jgi:hypothetical protein
MLSLLVLFLAIVAAGTASAQTGGTLPAAPVLQNGQLRLEFETIDNAPDPGTRLELVSARHVGVLPLPPPVQMAPRSGGWTVRLVGQGSGGGDWLEFSADGSVVLSETGIGSLDDLVLEEVTLSTPPPTLFARWSAEVTFDGETVPLEVRTQWALLPGEPFADTTMRVILPDLPDLGVYLGQARHPDLKISDYGTPDDTLVVPWVSGNLVRNPTDPTLKFPFKLSQSTFFLFPVNVTAYYDAATPSRCLYLATTDADDHLKELLIGVDDDADDGPQQGGRHVTMNMRHLPADVFDVRDWETPYGVRVGVFEGDWWDVVAAWRRHRASDVPWYQGPVGSPAHPMPAAGKQVVAELLFVPGYEGDHMDMLTRQVVAMSRILGRHVNVYLYGAYMPDRFFHWYLDGGYLPGRPSFAGAVRESQKQFGHVVSPYVCGTLAADWTDPALQPPITDPPQVLVDAYDSFAIDETGAPRFVASAADPPRSGVLCAGGPWARDAFPEDAREIALFSEMKGIYLDYWLTWPCFSTEHLHAPGGGDWMNVMRMEQLRDLTAAPHEELVVPMEFVHGRFTEEVDTMHVDPAENLLSAEDYPGTTIQKPMENAETIPLFRALFDNVKLSRITTRVPSLPGRRSWIEAANIFTFGQVPSVNRAIPELIPIFSERYLFAPNYHFLSKLPTSDGSIGFGAATGPTDTPTFVPDKGSLAVPYLRFLRVLTEVLRDQGFLLWHNGTIRKLPERELTLVAPPGFDGQPGAEAEIDDGVQTNTPMYVEEPIVPGMFQAPKDLLPPEDIWANSLAFVAANPWVDPAEAAVFDLDFTFVPDPIHYPGWNPLTFYTVTRFDADGGVSQLPGQYQGAFTLTDHAPLQRLQPEDVYWWVFREVQAPGP